MSTHGHSICFHTEIRKIFRWMLCNDVNGGLSPYPSNVYSNLEKKGALAYNMRSIQ